MKSITLFFLLAVRAVPAPVQAQSSPLLVHHFMRDVLNPRIKESDIIDTYLCRYLHDVPDKAENKNYVFAKGQITGIREYLRQEKITVAQLNFYRYADIPMKDQNVAIAEKGDVYVCYYDSKVFNYFLINQNRIDAFTTMNKSGQRFFISHCQ